MLKIYLNYKLKRCDLLCMFIRLRRIALLIVETSLVIMYREPLGIIFKPYISTRMWWNRDCGEMETVNKEKRKKEGNRKGPTP